MHPPDFRLALPSIASAFACAATIAQRMVHYSDSAGPSELLHDRLDLEQFLQPLVLLVELHLPWADLGSAHVPPKLSSHGSGLWWWRWGWWGGGDGGGRLAISLARPRP